MTINRQEILLTLLVAFLVGAVVLYTFEFPVFSRTLEMGRLLWYALPGGLLVGAVTAIWLPMNDWDWYSKMRVRVTVVVLCTLFAPLVVSLTNRLGISPEGETNLTFVKEEFYYQSRFGDLDGASKTPTGVYAHFFTERGKHIRFQYDQPRFTEVRPGQKLQIPTVRGRWGFAVVQDEF